VVVRKLPETKCTTPSPPTPSEAARDEGFASAVALQSPRPQHRFEVKPLAPERYKIQFTLDRETHDNLRCAQNLLRHTIPDGDPAKIFAKALALLIQDVSRKKLANAKRPRSAAQPPTVSRNIPAAVRRVVWTRDRAQCAFRGARGRCAETGFLEFHHVQPYADGGQATTDNIELRCRAHNAYEAELDFGSERQRSRARRDSNATDSEAGSRPTPLQRE
jgi:hypothetical protein